MKHGIPEHPDSFDFDFYAVAMLQENLGIANVSDTGGRPRRNHITGLERHRLGNVRYESGNVENQISRVGLLQRAAVEPQFDS